MLLYDLKKINPEGFLINISVLADKARLLRQVTEMLSKRPSQFLHWEMWKHVNLIQLMEDIPHDPRHPPDLCIPMGLHTWDSLVPLVSMEQVSAPCTMSPTCLSAKTKATPVISNDSLFAQLPELY